MNRTVLYLHGPMVNTSRNFLSGLSAFAAERRWTIHEVFPPRGADASYLRNLDSFWHPLGIVATYGLDRGLPLPPGDLTTPVICIDIDPKQRAGLAIGATTRFGFVSCDSRDLTALAARSLLSRDFASYAYVSNYLRTHWSEARERDFRRLIELDGRYYASFDGAGLATSGTDSAQRFRQWLAQLPKPCGLLAANDRTASIVLSSAAHEGIDVPEELSVIGIDNDSSLCEAVSPPLTSIEVDFHQAGRLAGKLISQLGRTRRGRILEAGYGAKELVVRLSTRRLAQSSPSVGKALEAIRQRAAEGISAADILPLIGGSRRTAEKRFRAAVGKSILEEILDVRFERLLSLLDNPDVPLGTLAVRAGFTSENHLQRLFKSRYGMTLSAWRRKRLAARIRSPAPRQSR